MQSNHQGWALIEIVVAMALLGWGFLATLTLQHQAVAVTERSIEDTQALGLALEMMASQDLGWEALHIETQINERLWSMQLQPTLRWADSASAPLVEVYVSPPSGDERVLRWQLPLPD